MKKFLFLIISFFVIIPLIKAETSLTSESNYIIVGDSFKVNLYLNYNTAKIQDCFYKITYDPNILSYENVNWNQTEASMIKEDDGIIYISKTSQTPLWEYGNVVSIRFTALKEGSVTIRVEKTAEAHYEDGNIIAQDLAPLPLVINKPNEETQVKNLWIDNYDLSPTFARFVYNYSVNVPAATDKITINATKLNDSQTITGIGEQKLNFGQNNFHIVVKAQNGQTSTYNISVYREDTRIISTDLSSISVSGKSIKLKKGVYDYEITVPKNTDNVTIIATPEAVATAGVAGATVIGGGTKQLKIGDNKFAITVKYVNKTQIYNLNIIRSEKEIIEEIKSNELETIQIDEENLLVDKEKDRYYYYINNKETIDLKITTISNTAKILIDDNKSKTNTDINTSNKKITLNNGINKINLIVNDNDVEEKQYQIIIFKVPTNTKIIDSFIDISLDNHLSYTTETINPIPLPLIKELIGSNYKIYYNVVKNNRLEYQVIIDNKIAKQEVNPTFTKVDNIYQTKLPKEQEITYYVGDDFSDDTNIRIYTINENGQYDLLTAGATVINGYINFYTNGSEQYVFTTIPLIKEEDTITKFINKYKTIFIMIIILIIAVPSYLIYKNKKEEKVSQNELPY